MAREFTVPFERLGGPQQITQTNIEEFKARGLDIHRHEVEDITDDHAKKVRRYRVKNTVYHDLGRRSR